MPGFILFFFAADLVLVLLYMISGPTNWGVGTPASKLTALVDMYGQGSVITWYSSVKLFLIAFFLALVARDKLDRRVRISWLLPVLPLLFAALSFEEIAQLHQFARFKITRLLPGLFMRNSPSYYAHAWLVLVGLPFAGLILALGFCLRQYAAGRRTVMLTYLVGLIAFVGAGAATEVFSNLIPLNTVSRVLQASGWGLGKLIGTTLMLRATYELVSASVGIGRAAPVFPGPRVGSSREPQK